MSASDIRDRLDMGRRAPDPGPDNRLRASELFAFLEESQWWDRDRLIIYQRQMLEGLARHARATTPFYMYRLEPLFRNDGSIDWNRWDKISLLSRQDLASYSANVRSRSVPAEHGPFFNIETSGSTGHAVSLTTTAWQVALTNAMGWRAQAWFDVDWSQTLLMRNYVPIKDVSVGDSLGPWGPPTHPKSRFGKKIYSPYNLDHDQFFDLMIDVRPAYVSIFSGSIDILCEISERRKSPLNVEIFFSRGGSISNQTREFAKRIFGARILESYSSQECGSIAYECPSGAGLHVSAEAALVEIVRDDGNHAQPGEDGRVVVTPFASSATPLVRYDQGDRAVVGDVCACGRHLPLIRSVLGREMQAFRHPDGTAFFGGRVAFLRQLIGASRWQVAQIGPLQFEVRYIADKDVDSSIIAEFVRGFRKSIFEDADIRLVRVADIPIGSSGKFVEYVNEWVVSKSRKGER